MWEMALPRKGSRTIVFNSHTYLWRVRRTSLTWRDIRKPGLYFILTIQRLSEPLTRPGNTAVFLLAARSSWFKLLPKISDKPGTNLCSSEVSVLIDYALDKGWDPTRIGPSFVVPHEEAPDLYKFNLLCANKV